MYKYANNLFSQIFINQFIQISCINPPILFDRRIIIGFYFAILTLDNYLLLAKVAEVVDSKCLQ